MGDDTINLHESDVVSLAAPKEITFLGILAFVMHCTLFVVFLVVVFIKNRRGIDLFALGMAIVSAFTIFTLYLGAGETWISLYFKRRALEERKRIKMLNKELGD
jgi:hypothetical protein